MIIRHWHGWTTADNADEYEKLLRTEIFPMIQQRGGEGLKGIELLRRQALSEIEFVTLLRFSSLQAVRTALGRNYETAFVPERARRLLTRFDERAAHYELR